MYLCFDFSKIKQPKIKWNQILNFIYKNWYEESRIKKDIMVNAFLTCGITQNLDGTEDDLFSGFQKLNE